MFVAAAIKELRTAVLPTMVALVRHYTMIAIAQQAGPFPAVGPRLQRLTGSVPDPDPHVFLGHKDPDPDPLVRGMDPDPDPSTIKQK